MDFQKAHLFYNFFFERKKEKKKKLLTYVFLLLYNITYIMYMT